nr:RNA-directed DNA polymerase, eukaryota, reverse transcriptase zinc-binding domain protein [Tanacetum cinerariifolium]
MSIMCHVCGVSMELLSHVFFTCDGATASVWFDKWSEGDPLANTVSSRDIFRAGLDFSTKVRDVILHGAWNWPFYLCAKYPNLSMLAVPNIMENTPDRLVWQNVQGIDKPFSVTQYSYCIPRHALTLWLIVKQRLKTQDRIYSWEASSYLSSLCPLCGLQPDSHDHLFFECPFSQQERNNRLFMNNKRTIQQLIECIKSSIRLKLVSCCFKKSKSGVRLAQEWTRSCSKAKVKWDIEGDENTSFFHGLLKQRRRLQMVQGIMHDGEWCTDPEQVKRTFLEFYRDKFAASQFVTPNLPQSRYNHLSAEEIKELERPITIDEIKYAVWQCGSDKFPGPDGFSFKFVNKYWEIMKQDIHPIDVDGILNVLNEFYNSLGLKINVGKSNMYDVGVSLDEIANMAASTGCAAGNLPFSYLGITSGESMATKGRWDNIV